MSTVVEQVRGVKAMPIKYRKGPLMGVLLIFPAYIKADYQQSGEMLRYFAYKTADCVTFSVSVCQSAEVWVCVCVH